MGKSFQKTVFWWLFKSNLKTFMQLLQPNLTKTEHTAVVHHKKFEHVLQRNITFLKYPKRLVFNAVTKIILRFLELVEFVEYRICRIIEMSGNVEFVEFCGICRILQKIL